MPDILKFKRILYEEIGTNFFDPTFRYRTPAFLIQGLLAAITVCVVLFFIDLFYNAIVGAALGATCLGLFLSPSGRISRIRSLAGGHSLAILLGCITSMFFYSSFGESMRESIPHIHVIALGGTCGVLFLAMQSLIQSIRLLLACYLGSVNGRSIQLLLFLYF